MTNNTQPASDLKNKAFTAVFLNPTKDEAGEITCHPKWSAGSWSHAIDDRDNYKHMFEDAIRSLAAIDNALGVDAEESGGAAPILEAIEKLKLAAAPAQPPIGNVPAEGYAFRCEGKLWVVTDPVVAMRWQEQGFLVSPVSAAPIGDVQLSDANILDVMQEVGTCRENDQADHIAFARAVISRALSTPRESQEPARVLDDEPPMQPVVIDTHGTARFKENAIVRHLLDNGGIDMNALAVLEFSVEDRMQFAQLIGYSVDGYGGLSYVTDESHERAASSPVSESQGGGK